MRGEPSSDNNNNDDDKKWLAAAEVHSQCKSQSYRVNH
jgi:hypothetical protein